MVPCSLRPDNSGGIIIFTWTVGALFLCVFSTWKNLNWTFSSRTFWVILDSNLKLVARSLLMLSENETGYARPLLTVSLHWLRSNHLGLILRPSGGPVHLGRLHVFNLSCFLLPTRVIKSYLPSELGSLCSSQTDSGLL